MKIFRIGYIRRSIIVLAGLAFLNMSFFLAEVSVLKLSGNKKLCDTIEKLISVAGCKEERDVAGETSESDVLEKEVDLLTSHSFTHQNIIFSIAQKKKRLLNDSRYYSGYLQKFSPPPEG